MRPPRPPQTAPPWLPVLPSVVSPSPSFFSFFLVSESLFPISRRLSVANNSPNGSESLPLITEASELETHSYFCETEASEHDEICMGGASRVASSTQSRRRGSSIFSGMETVTRATLPGLLLHWEKSARFTQAREGQGITPDDRNKPGGLETIWVSVIYS